MLAVEDCLDSLKWIEEIGGLPETIRRVEENYAAVERWVEETRWAGFLAMAPETRSQTSVCLQVVDPWFTALEGEAQAGFIKDLCKRLEQEEAAYDIAGYRDAPPGLRIWCGATVETSDAEALLLWLDWAYEAMKAEAQQEAA